MIDLPHELTSEDYAGAGDDRAMIALNRQAIGFAREAVEDYQHRPRHFRPGGQGERGGERGGGRPQPQLRRASDLARRGRSEMLDAQAMRELTGSAPLPLRASTRRAR
jgi:hypothetical protein